MNTDLKITQLDDGSFDLSIGNNGDFEGDEGLSTTTFVSILTNARAEESDVYRPESRGGWLGNLNFPLDGAQLGSLFWLIEQRRRTTDNLNKAIDAVEKSLQWMIDGLVIKNVEVSGSLLQDGARIQIDLTSFSDETESFYVPLWRNTING